MNEYNISAITTGLTPLKKPSSILEEELAKYKYAKAITIQNDGIVAPNRQTNTPFMPFIL